MPQTLRFCRALAAAVLALALFAPQSALAQVGPPPPPASAPATQPAATQPAVVLRPSPLRTLVWHAMMMSAGNVQGVRDCYTADTPEHQAIVDAYAHLAESLGKLRKSATDRFGPPGFDAIGFGPMFADEIKRIEQSQYAVQGDSASVTAGKAPPLALVWKADSWRISVAESFARNPKRRAARINAQASAYEALAADIAAGKYKLALEARQAGTEKVAAAMKAAEAELSATPTSTPSTTEPSSR